MIRFSERALIALEKAPKPIKSKLTRILHDLELDRPLSSRIFHRRMKYRDGVWIVKAERTLLYSKKNDEITVLDILDPTEYRHD